jgi:hypothetical protein
MRNDGIPVKYTNVKLEKASLFDLAKDPGETTDVAARNPKILAKLNSFAAQARADLGDALTGDEGTGNRKAGRLTKE